MNCLATSCRRPGFSTNVFKSDSHPGASSPVMDKCITIVPALSSSAASILCDFSRSSVDRSIWHLSIRNRWVDFQVTTQRNQVFQYKKLCTSSKDYGISIFLWRSILKGWGWQGKTLRNTIHEIQLQGTNTLWSICLVDVTYCQSSSGFWKSYLAVLFLFSLNTVLVAIKRIFWFYPHSFMVVETIKMYGKGVLSAFFTFFLFFFKFPQVDTIFKNI